MTHHSQLSSLVLASLVLSVGCAGMSDDQHQACAGLAAAEAEDPNAMPPEIIDYLDHDHWSHMHLDFHVARMWDGLDADTQKWAADQGIARWKLQEGQATTGLEFLAMHRMMLTELRAKFPEHADRFVGWTQPPTDPADVTGMLPEGTPAFDDNMLVAIDKLQNHIDAFATDDDMALFLQTKRRPTAANPKHRSSDPAAGIHNYLHNRWTSNSPINVGDPALNLKNQVFWRIHGWVDARWTAYRAAKGLDDATDEVYMQAMQDAQVWMDDVMQRDHDHDHAGKTDDGCEQVPDSVRNIFAE